MRIRQDLYGNPQIALVALKGNDPDILAGSREMTSEALNPDLQAAKLSVQATPSFLSPPDHRMVEIQVNVQVSDNRDPNPVVRLESITSNQGDLRLDQTINSKQTIFARMTYKKRNVQVAPVQGGTTWLIIVYWCRSRSALSLLT